MNLSKKRIHDDIKWFHTSSFAGLYLKPLRYSKMTILLDSRICLELLHPCHGRQVDSIYWHQPDSTGLIDLIDVYYPMFLQMGFVLCNIKAGISNSTCLHLIFMPSDPLAMAYGTDCCRMICDNLKCLRKHDDERKATSGKMSIT